MWKGRWLVDRKIVHGVGIAAKYILLGFRFFFGKNMLVSNEFLCTVGRNGCIQVLLAESKGTCIDFGQLK